MKKILLTIILGIFLISFSVGLISACSRNNAFTLGEDMKICSGDCIYQNATDLNYVNCDSTISCFFSASYNNGTFIMNNTEGSLVDKHFEINFTKYLTNAETGIYQGQLQCHQENKGYTEPVNFEFSISSVTSTTSSASGQNAFSLPSAQIVKDNFKQIGEGIFKTNKFYIFLFFLCFLFIGFILADLKKHRIKKIAVQVSKILKTGKIKKK